MAWIRTIRPEAATGALREEYDRARKRAGGVAAVVTASSLKPGVLSRWVELYQEVMYGTSDLSRAEREMVAVVVSQSNDCHY